MRRSWLLAALLLAACAGERPAPRPAPPPWQPQPRREAPPRRQAPPSPRRQVPPPRPAAPAWQAKRVVPDAVPTTGGRLHTVKPGETGIAIARAYGVSWDRVVTMNGLAPPYTLRAGQKLLLPSAAVVASQSVEERARAFRVDVDDLITGSEPARRTAAPLRPTSRPSPPAATSVAPPPLLAAGTPDFRWPVDGRVLSGFGPKPGGRFNDGVNLKASLGSPVRAAGDGVVAYAGDDIPGFGNLVLIKHPGGWVSAYGHNDTLLVARGRPVAKGEVIARAGQTGAVTEPQLHFELRRGRTPIDPVRVLGGR